MRRALRITAGLSQEHLANELGVSRAAISRWETGDRSPRGQNRVAYAAALRELQELAR
jgi:HTH-type transcriptional regulator/antitoxin MqsA